MEQLTPRAQRAGELFRQGYNCAQSVFCAFSDLTHIPEQTSARLAGGFGGGIGRMREVCGAVSGAVLTLSCLCGYDDPKDAQAKASLYRLVQEFANRYRSETGSIICRELLQGVPTQPGSTPEDRTPSYYKKRPCAELVMLSAQILDEMLSQMHIAAAQ